KKLIYECPFIIMFAETENCDPFFATIFHKKSTMVCGNGLMALWIKEWGRMKKNQKDCNSEDKNTWFNPSRIFRTPVESHFANAHLFC
ncbi:MAG: hypothetical protein PF692_15305, partial [Kiritimatiellae bacterium]|nr:hypothetical protein [Kiritimatiellia bacterium]